jgi:putative ABC transport system permease protein
MFLDYLKISYLMMKAKPIRAALSLLGIYIGVLALVIILSIREGIRFQLNDLFRTSGAQVLFVYPGFDQVRKKIGRLGDDDITRLKAVPGILSVASRRTSEQDVKSANVTAHLHLAGIDDKFVAVYRVPLIRGRVFLSSEVESNQAVCLITDEATRKLFPSGEPIGDVVDIQGVAYQILGVVEWNTAVGQRTSIPDVDVLLPAGRMSAGNSAFISNLEVLVDPKILPAQALRLVKDSISHGDSQREAQYFVRSLDQMVERNRAFNDRILAGLLGIAAISLLVGGIGVANVMVTSVTERTREVGIRKALGARRIDILAQFMIESSVLCGTGGLLAVLTGALGINLVPTLFQLSTPLIIPFLPVFACFVLTLFIGLLAGGYPASRAASLSPAEALRYE